jgi:hypothetical protein
MVPGRCRKYYSRFSSIVFRHILLECDKKNSPKHLACRAEAFQRRLVNPV